MTRLIWAATRPVSRVCGELTKRFSSALVIDVPTEETEVMDDADLFGDSVSESGDPVDDTDDLDPIEALTGDDPDEAMETGYSPPEREPYNLRHMQTASEALRGESLDERLAEEEPDITAEEEPDITVGEEPDINLDDQDVADVQPRAGRLVAPDEGAHTVLESDEIANDVGPAGYASSAEEAAMHIVEGDEE